MSMVPEKLFVNIYPKSIGPCVGSAFETQDAADRYANSHRLFCVELGAKVVNSVVVSEACAAQLAVLSKRTGRDPAWLIENALAVHLLIPNEIRALLHRWAAETQVSYAGAIAECCRGYMTEAAR